MAHVTLRQLGYFDALARHSHFGRAAAACAISQPALSMQIKELEESLGAVLIERGARQLRLTKFGEEAALRVRDILRSVDELGDFARASLRYGLERYRRAVIARSGQVFATLRVAGRPHRHVQIVAAHRLAVVLADIGVFVAELIGEHDLVEVFLVGPGCGGVRAKTVGEKAEFHVHSLRFLTARYDPCRSLTTQLDSAPTTPPIP